MASYPLKGYQHTELGNHRRMETSITISDTGRIDGITKTWTSKKYKGFTGSVIVFLTDAEGNIHHATEPHSYGVNGTAVGEHKRNEPWSENISIDVLNNISGYAIHHAHTPVIRVTPDLFKEWAEAVAPIIKAFNNQEFLLKNVEEAEELNFFD